MSGMRGERRKVRGLDRKVNKDENEREGGIEVEDREE